MFLLELNKNDFYSGWKKMNISSSRWKGYNMHVAVLQSQKYTNRSLEN